MPTPPLHTYDYAIVRVVPRVERGEFINAGVIVSCRTAGFLAARVALDRERFAALAPGMDPHDIVAALDAVPRICEGGAHAGPLAGMSARERFHWLVAPRSSSLQVSPVHSGRCSDPEAALHRLFEQLVQVHRPD